MAYTHITLAQLETDLAARLYDPSNRFWLTAELGLYITEALRAFGIMSAFWRARGTLATSIGQVFYELPDNLLSGTEYILGYTVTDRDLVEIIQYHLLESASTQSIWAGTEMFSLNDIQTAIENRRNQFLSDAGGGLTRTIQNVSSPPIGREQLNQSVIDVRRAAWLGAPPENYYTNLWREDERALTAANTTWIVNQGPPSSFSVMAPPPLQIQISPPPQSAGQIELITVNSGVALDTANAGTILGIPDDLCWVVKWGALADLLGRDGEARDPQRAQYAEQRYQQGVQLARLLPVVLNGEINGVPLIPDTLQSIDGASPNWQNTLNTPTMIMIPGSNMIALNPVPDDIYSVTLDVVRRAVVPIAGSSDIQVGREQLSMIMDYAEHLALFKVHGEEWQATMRQADNFFLQSLTYNQRLSAAARYVAAARDTSTMEKQRRPRRLDAEGIGSYRGQ